MCIWDIDVAILFLMLASITIMAKLGEEDDWSVISLSCCERFLSFLSLLAKLKEKRPENLLVILEPGLNSRWRGEKAGKIL